MLLDQMQMVVEDGYYGKASAGSGDGIYAGGAGNPCGIYGDSHGSHACDGTGGLLIIKCDEFQNVR